MPVLNKEELGRIPFAETLLKISGIQRVNRLYDNLIDFQGPGFAGRFLEDAGAHYTLANPEKLSELPSGPFITISNHPYGGVDGIALIDIFGHIRPDYKVMVNKFLSRVKTLEPNFITVSPNNNDSNGVHPDSIAGVRACLKHLSEGSPLGLFPSGAVSDLKWNKGLKISDREWQLPIIKVIKKVRVPIIPVRFFDHNSAFFYLLGLLGWKIRTTRLPYELINKTGKPFRIAIGDTISVAQQDVMTDLTDFSAFLRSSVYDMPVPPPSESMGCK